MTARSGKRGSGMELDERQAEVLRSVIRSHIESGEPVGSRTVSRGARLRLSPASIRSIMADLEERGLLTRTHSSAGRVPTDPAYRQHLKAFPPILCSGIVGRSRYERETNIFESGRSAWRVAPSGGSVTGFSE